MYSTGLNLYKHVAGSYLGKVPKGFFGSFKGDRNKWWHIALYHPIASVWLFTLWSHGRGNYSYYILQWGRKGIGVSLPVERAGRLHMILAVISQLQNSVRQEWLTLWSFSCIHCHPDKSRSWTEEKRGNRISSGDERSAPKIHNTVLNGYIWKQTIGDFILPIYFIKLSIL